VRYLDRAKAGLELVISPHLLAANPAHLDQPARVVVDDALEL